MTDNKLGGSKKAIMGLFFLVFAFFLVFVFFSVRAIKSFDGTGKLLALRDVPIGVVEISGVILSSKKVIKHLLEAEEDNSIKAIIIRVNSPGGAVAPSQEIYEEIRRINEKKPVFASFSSVAASGGYYIGAAARKIYSNPGTLTGSIGVIMQFMNLEKLYDFLKLDPSVLKSGRYKDTGSEMRSMTNEEKVLMQKMIDGVHRQFIADIVKTRKDRIKGNIKDHAQGQIFSGEEALELGLVDELLGLQAAGRKIHQELKLKGKFGLKYFKEEEKTTLKDFLFDAQKALLNHFPSFMFLWKKFS